MLRFRTAIVAAAIPLVAFAGAANAQDRYPPSPVEGPGGVTDVLGETFTNDEPANDAPAAPDETVSVLPAADVRPDARPPAAAPDNALAATGADVALLGLSGLAALTAGAGAVYAARRREA